VAEATALPVMPDAVLVPLALARPAGWWRLSLAAMLGTAVGGMISYRLGRRSPTAASIARLPLVRPAMIEATERWLASEGARGVARQPLTGVPFKVFARLAGARGLPLGPFLAWALVGRGLRFLLVSGLAALSGHQWPVPVRRHLPTLTLAWSLVFALALRRTVAYWGRASR
jgi:membrane protein YqaA with SNARE-associated domain